MGSITKRVLEDERYFTSIAVTYRGFYNRIAIISDNEEMKKYYNPDYLIEDFSEYVYKMISNERCKVFI